MMLFLTSIGEYLLSQENNFLVAIHDRLGEVPFIVLSLGTAIVLGLVIIPYSTNLMTNSAAGLTEKFLGKKQRTLVINSTTNLPELFLMLLSLGLRRLGGIATPLGSNLANIYLMFAIVPIMVISKWLIFGQKNQIIRLLQLLKREKKLVIWHLLLSFTLLLFSVVGCWSITGVFPVINLFFNQIIRTDYWLLRGSFICLIGVGIYFFFEQKLKRRRPQLFEEIEDEAFEPNWSKFVVGTTGVIVACYLLNLWFMTFTELYEPFLKSYFGTAIFTSLHYFIGSLISSLPETTIAMENYERLTVSDLNTALASATVSNMSNLAIAFFGGLLASLFLL